MGQRATYVEARIDHRFRARCMRGMGLLQALELVKDRKTKEPAREELASLTRDQQLIIGKGGLYGNVVRLSPPLTISRSDVDEAIRRLDAAFAAL